MSIDPNLIARLAQQGGLPPEAAGQVPVQGQAPMPAPAPTPQAPMPPAKPGKDTAEAQAQADGAPRTAADQQSADPVIYEVDMGDGNKRKFTPTQIAGMSSRYADMNHRHANLKPVIDLAEEMLRRNPNITAQDLTETILSLGKAQQHNPTMGHGSDQQMKQSMGMPDDDALTKWESENAATLPPGYREFMAQSRTLGSQVGQQTALLQRLLAQSAGVADGARQAMQGAQSQVIDARKQAIGSNLDRAQMELQIPDNQANNFMVWSAERGYTLEDFIDLGLTRKVMQDFRNGVLSGETERLQSIHQKRQAFTGTVGQQPSAGGSPQQSSADKDFGDFSGRMLAKRGMGV